MSGPLVLSSCRPSILFALQITQDERDHHVHIIYLTKTYYAKPLSPFYIKLDLIHQVPSNKPIAKLVTEFLICDTGGGYNCN